MKAGQLRRKLVIQQQVRTPDGGGGSTPPTWTTVLTTWGKVTDLSGREQFAAMQVSAHAMKRFSFRYPPSTPITEAMRLLDGSPAYNIRNVSDTDERHAELVLLCELIPGYQ